jgi:hypothetical protein
MIAPPPNIDLLCTYEVIDDTTDPPRWRIIGRGVYCPARAREAAEEQGYHNPWINDGSGRRPAF